MIHCLLFPGTSQECFATLPDFLAEGGPCARVAIAHVHAQVSLDDRHVFSKT